MSTGQWQILKLEDVDFSSSGNIDVFGICCLFRTISMDGCYYNNYQFNTFYLASPSLQNLSVGRCTPCEYRGLSTDASSLVTSSAAASFYDGITSRLLHGPAGLKTLFYRAEYGFPEDMLMNKTFWQTVSHSLATLSTLHMRIYSNTLNVTQKFITAAGNSLTVLKVIIFSGIVF